MSRKAINRSSLLVPRVPTVGNKQHTVKNKEAPKDLVASEAFIQKLIVAGGDKSDRIFPIMKFKLQKKLVRANKM